jgi:hypothetical protein
MCVLVAVVSLLSIVNSPLTESTIAIVRVVAVVWALGILGVLLSDRDAPRLWLARVAFAIAPIPLFPTFWLLIGERAVHRLPLEAFVRQELVCIVYALATPPSAAISLMVITAFTIDGLILLWWVGPHAQLVATQRWQPWTLLAYGAFAAALALYRARRQRREVAMLIEAQRVAAMRRLMQTYLAVQDLVNTPLQTLHISISLLHRRFPRARNIARTMGRSLKHLAQLNRVLSDETAKIEWKRGGESMDPLRVLQAALREE